MPRLFKRKTAWLDGQAYKSEERLDAQEEKINGKQ